MTLASQTVRAGRRVNLNSSSKAHQDGNPSTFGYFLSNQFYRVFSCLSCILFVLEGYDSKIRVEGCWRCLLPGRPGIEILKRVKGKQSELVGFLSNQRKVTIYLRALSDGSSEESRASNRPATKHNYEELLEKLDNEGLFQPTSENHLQSSNVNEILRRTTPERKPKASSESPKQNNLDVEFTAEGLSQLSQRSLNIADLPKEFWEDYVSPSDQKPSPKSTPKPSEIPNPTPQSSLKRSNRDPASSPIRPPTKRTRTESEEAPEIPDSQEDQLEPVQEQELTASQQAEAESRRYLADPNVRDQTCLNPEFIQNYYQQSRLHHLSACTYSPPWV